MNKLNLIVLAVFMLLGLGLEALNLSECFEGSECPAFGWSIVYGQNPPNPGNAMIHELTGFAHQGQRSFRFSSLYIANPYDQYLITPRLVVSEENRSISFWYFGIRGWFGDECWESFRVGWSATGTELTDFTWGPEVEDADSDTWRLYQKNDLPLGTKYVAVHYTTIGGYSLYLDSFSGPELYITEYPEPTNHVTGFRITSSGTQSISLAFTGSEGGQLPCKYLIQAKVPEADYYSVLDIHPILDDNDWSDGLAAKNIIHHAGENTVFFDGLPMNQEIEFTIWPYTNFDVGTNYKTDPAAPSVSGFTLNPTPFPYSQGFEEFWTGNPSAPTDWSQISVYGNNPWTMTDFVAHNGSYCAMAPFANEGGEHLLITPPLFLANGNYRLRFWLRGSQSSGTDLKVQISSDNGSAEAFSTTLANYVAGVNMPIDWTEQVIDLSSFSGVQYIAFRMLDSDGFRLFIDDVMIEEFAVVPTPLPYLETFEAVLEPDLPEGWTVENTNSDPRTWLSYGSFGSMSARILYNSQMEMNDWLISPPVSLTAGTEYKLKFDYKGNGMVERLELKVGTSPSSADLQTQIYSNHNIANSVYDIAECTFTPLSSGLYYFGWHACSEANTWFIQLDNLKILLPQSEVAQSSASGGFALIDLPQFDTEDGVIDASIQITPVVAFTLVTASATYGNSTIPNSGLTIGLSGADFGGTSVQIAHFLGYVPDQVYVRIGSGDYNLYANPGIPSEWNDALVTIHIPETKAEGELEIVFLRDEDTLPVELSAFTASVNACNNAQITWVTQAESELRGFYLYRAHTGLLESAAMISPLIPATNTSQQQVYAYTDQEMLEPGTYYYWLQISNLDGSGTYHGPISLAIETGNNPSAPSLPLKTEFSSIFPNPFNPSTQISYSLSRPEHVKFFIYNGRGQVVRSMILGTKAAGNWRQTWDGTDDAGRTVASGIYFILMQAGKDSFTRKAILLK